MVVLDFTLSLLFPFIPQHSDKPVHVTAALSPSFTTIDTEQNSRATGECAQFERRVYNTRHILTPIPK